jgi:hypothetical protein
MTGIIEAVTLLAVVSTFRSTSLLPANIRPPRYLVYLVIPTGRVLVLSLLQSGPESFHPQPLIRSRLVVSLQRSSPISQPVQPRPICDLHLCLTFASEQLIIINHILISENLLRITTISVADTRYVAARHSSLTV